MDALTHTLAALTLSRGIFRRPPARTTPTLLIAAIVSDIDYLYSWGSATFAYEHNHGWTHSIAGALLLATATAFVVRQSLQKQNPQGAHPLRPHLLAAGLGAASHLLLDWTTTAGVRFLWPFRATMFRLDWFSMDLWLLVFLLLGLALPALLRLIAEEIGARRDDRSRLRAARVTLAACLLLAGARAILHGQAVGQLEARNFQGRTPLRAAALPTPLNPFRWGGIVETPTTYELAEVRLLGARRPAEPSTTIYKPSPSPALQVALATPTARAYLSRARFPQVEILPAAGEGWEIRMQDLASAERWRGMRQFSARIELDRDLTVVSESLSYGQARR